MLIVAVVQTAISMDPTQSVTGKTRFPRRTSSTGPSGRVKRASLILRVAKFLPPVLRQTFFFLKRMSGELMSGR